MAALPLLFGYAKALARNLKRLPGKHLSVEPPEDLLFLFNELRTKLHVPDVGLIYVKRPGDSRPFVSPVRALIGRVVVSEEVWPQMGEDERRFALAWKLRQANRAKRNFGRPFWNMTRLLFALGLSGAIHPLVGVLVITYFYTPRKRMKGSKSEQTFDLLRAMRECPEAHGPLAFIARLSDPKEARTAGAIVCKHYGLPPEDGQPTVLKTFSWIKALPIATGNVIGLWIAALLLNLLGNKSFWEHQNYLIAAMFPFCLAVQWLNWVWLQQQQTNVGRDGPEPSQAP